MPTKRQPQRRRIPNVPLAQQPVSTNPQLAARILEIVDTQLQDGDPPETKQTLERLLGLGYTPEGARQLLAHVVVAEIFTVMAQGQQYSQARFIASLHRLPAIPFADHDQGTRS